MTPRQAARAAGLTRYEGRPCRTCGGTVRYVCNKACARCETERARAMYANDSEYRERLKADRRDRYDAMTGVEYARKLLMNRRRMALKRMAARNAPDKED